MLYIKIQSCGKLRGKFNSCTFNRRRKTTYKGGWYLAQKFWIKEYKKEGNNILKGEET